MNSRFETFKTSESGNAQTDTFGTSERFTSDTYTTSIYPYKLSPECSEVQAKVAQIIDLDIPHPLFKKRHELKTKMNNQLIFRLPLELISYIFALIVDETHENRWYNEGEWNPVVMLGAVCRRWREITLDTPQLWTKFFIAAQNLKYASFSNIVAERLSRSRSLPLSLVVIGDDFEVSFPGLSYSNIVPILRSEAHRWKELEIQGTVSMLHVLLTGLEDKLNVDSLIIHLDDPDPYMDDKIAMKYPFTPKRLNIENVPLPQIPIDWGALTHLSANDISVNDLLHVFPHAQNLQYCRLYVVIEDAEYHPLPTSPITNTSIKRLQIDSQGVESDIGTVLCHLILPSLDTLDYTIDNDDPYYTEEMQGLAGFLDRSQAPLHNFSFTYVDIDWELSTDWYHVLPHITSLELRVSECFHQGERMQEHLEQLGAHVEPMVLPRLRELRIHAEIMNSYSWTALAAMFPDDENKNDRARPLNSVKIYLDAPSDFDQKNMLEATHARLCAIRKSGVKKIQVFGDLEDKTEILGPWDPKPLGSDAGALFSAYCLLSDDE